jgi:two-component system, NarL family, nitrate/nitrite response regulator NarL
MAKKIKILIVDDHVIFREGLVSLFKNQPDFEVIGEAGSVAKAIKISNELQPDLVLLDIGLPDGNGLEATHAILNQNPDTKIVILTVHESDALLFDAIRRGAKGYLLKNTSVSKLVSSLRALERGEAALSRAMTGRILDEFRRMGKISSSGESMLENLTPRELEVLEKLGTDSTNKQIASSLVISEYTVKNHIHNILKKLNFTNRREAAKFSRRVFYNQGSNESISLEL